MAQRPPSQKPQPAEIIGQLTGGYNGYTDPTVTVPQMWFQAANVFASQDGFIHRCRFANVKAFSPATGLPFTTLKYFALPGLSAYLLGDINNKMFGYDTGAAYAQTQRINPYVDPSGVGNASLAGPWSRQTLQNIVYEMNGLVKQSGRNANAATVEGFGLDSPDASPQVIISTATGSTVNITSITRLNGVVTATMASSALIVPGGNGIGFINVVGVTDTSFNGTFVIVSGSGTATLVWSQLGQNVSSSGGSVNVQITKSVGRSYSWAWENANKPHVGAPSPSTQFIQYNIQNGQIQLIEPGLVTTNGTTTVTGVGTFFTTAWIGRSLWIASLGTVGRIIAVASVTSLTLAAAAATSASNQFQVYDPQSTHVRLYETADGQATYFRVQRNAWVPTATTLLTAGLLFFDNGQSEPPNFPFTTETSQLNNIPPPIGSFIYEYGGRLLVFGITGSGQSFFYSNSETTSIGMPQESFAPLNQVTLPIQNAKINGMLEFPGQLIIWSDKNDMFRMTGLLTDNSVLNVASTQTGAQQGASISSLPYSLGIANPYASDMTPLGGIWLTQNAEIWLFTGTYAPRNIGRPVQDILNSIPKANLALARAKYFHANNRNWWAVAIPAGAGFNNTVLILDIDLLASNGSPSYFTFDMATNSPSWYVFQPGPFITQYSISNNATLIQSSGGTLNKKFSSRIIVSSVVGHNYLISGTFDNLASVPLVIRLSNASGSSSQAVTIAPGVTQSISLNLTGDGSQFNYQLETQNISDNINCIGFNALAFDTTTSTALVGLSATFQGAWAGQSGAVITLTQNTGLGVPVSSLVPRCDSIESVYEAGGAVRLLIGGIDLIQDIDYQSFLLGSEIQVPGANVGLHAYGNDSAFMIKRPGFFRFNTNQDPSTLGPDGWSFEVLGIDDDFYTFAAPLILNLTPGVNDVASLCGNPDLFRGESFRFSPALFKVGGVNFVMGRRLRFVVNFPALIGNNYALSNIQIGFGVSPPR